jgi:hypothetical protein
MVTVTVDFLTVWALLFGRITSKAEEVTNVEVSMKKIKSKKTKSVMEDILNSADILLLFLRFIEIPSNGFVQKV